jgi:hypothetical protein
MARAGARAIALSEKSIVAARARTDVVPPKRVDVVSPAGGIALVPAAAIIGSGRGLLVVSLVVRLLLLIAIVSGRVLGAEHGGGRGDRQ